MFISYFSNDLIRSVFFGHSFFAFCIFPFLFGAFMNSISNDRCYVNETDLCHCKIKTSERKECALTSRLLPKAFTKPEIGFFHDPRIFFLFWSCWPNSLMPSTWWFVYVSARAHTHFEYSHSFKYCVLVDEYMATDWSKIGFWWKFQLAFNVVGHGFFHSQSKYLFTFWKRFVMLRHEIRIWCGRGFRSQNGNIIIDKSLECIEL